MILAVPAGARAAVRAARRGLVNMVLPPTTVGTMNLSYREAWLERTLSSVPSGLKILDAGAGELQYKRYCEHLEYTSQDLGEYDGHGDAAGLHSLNWDNSRLDIRSDIVGIPVEDESFDAIMCIEVLEHVPRPIDALCEFVRILRPGGRLIVTTPVSSLTHFAPFYFYNGYSRYFFEKILADLGFTEIVIEYNGNYFESVAEEVRRIHDAGARYSPGVRSTARIHWLAQRVLLRRLQELSDADSGSEELSSHGLHVTARKPGNQLPSR